MNREERAMRLHIESVSISVVKKYKMAKLMDYVLDLRLSCSILRRDNKDLRKRIYRLLK